MEHSLSENLKKIFDAYTASTGGLMEGKSFAKLAKDCSLLDKKLTAADVDLIFAKVKINKTERKIGFKEFVEGIS